MLADEGLPTSPSVRPIVADRRTSLRICCRTLANGAVMRKALPGPTYILHELAQAA